MGKIKIRQKDDKLKKAKGADVTVKVKIPHENKRRDVIANFAKRPSTPIEGEAEILAIKRHMTVHGGTWAEAERIVRNGYADKEE